MNADEKYLFDLNGYLVVKNVLTPEEVALANEAIDKHGEQTRIRSREQSFDGGSPDLKGEHGRGDLDGMLHWGRTLVQPVPTHARPSDACPISQRDIRERLPNGSSDVPAFDGTKAQKGIRFMDPLALGSIRINIISSGMGGCTTD